MGGQLGTPGRPIDLWTLELRLPMVTLETRHPKQVAVTGREQDIQNTTQEGWLVGSVGKVLAVPA